MVGFQLTLGAEVISTVVASNPVCAHVLSSLFGQLLPIVFLHIVVDLPLNYLYDVTAFALNQRFIFLDELLYDVVLEFIELLLPN